MSILRPYEILAKDIQRLEPHNFQRMAIGIGSAVTQSFATVPARRTAEEIKRRMDAAAELLQRLRRDDGRSIFRALDELPEALRIELLGGEYRPDRRSSWIRPNDARKVVSIDEVAREVARHVMERPS